MKQFFLFSALGMSVMGSVYPQANLPSTPREQAALEAVLSLKQRQPNWRSEIIKTFANGNPEQILLYEPLITGGEHPVKQISFYENGRIQAEMDVAQVAEDAPGAIQWKSTIVPHGARVELNADGQLRQIAQYRFGLLEGDSKTFFPNGKLETSSQYLHGVLNGVSQAFFANEQLKEELHYYNGQIDGDYVQYYENGAKALLFPHEEGKLHGVSCEWFPSGVLKFQRRFVQGVLHGDGKNPAVIAYDESRNIIEVVDFRQGVPFGMHIRYHKNGQEAYRVAYKNGKEEGKKQFFSESGSLLGEGSFSEGVPYGTHWRNYPDGQPAYLAKFDEEGNLLAPILEYHQNGNTLREYQFVKEKLDGPYFEWYPDGSLKLEYFYEAGNFEGEQKEYYPTGQMKVCSHYKNGQHDGIH